MPRTVTERALLEERIRTQSLDEGARVETFALGDDDGELRRLMSELPGDAWLQPLRLICLPKPRSGASSLLQDLIALGIENPGRRRRRRILAEEPERVRAAAR